MDWRWDTTVHRYRDWDSGRFISKSTVMDLLSQSMRGSETAIRMLNELGIGQTLRASEWEQLVRAELKREYIRQYLPGVGGLKQMTSADWSSIGGLLKNQYAYLHSLAQDLEAGNLSLAKLNQLSAMYINSAHTSFERAHTRSAITWGADEVLWVMTPGLQHCDTCKERANMSWVKANADGGFPESGSSVWPADGSSQCLTNDGCTLRYRRSSTGEEYQ